MRVPTILLAALALTGAHAKAAPPAAAPTGAGGEIARIMRAQADAWNRGDLKGFLALSYEKGPGVVFVRSSGLVRGYDAVSALFAKTYGAGSPGMGRLSYSHIETRPISPDYAMVYGAYRLDYAAGRRPDRGVFDLLFHKGPEGWRVVSDHTS